MTGVVLLSIIVVGAAMLAMAVGTLVSRNRCLRGSCGGLQSGDFEPRGITCDTCPLSNESAVTAMHQRPPQPRADRAKRLSRLRGERR